LIIFLIFWVKVISSLSFFIKLSIHKLSYLFDLKNDLISKIRIPKLHLKLLFMKKWPHSWSLSKTKLSLAWIIFQIFHSFQSVSWMPDSPATNLSKFKGIMSWGVGWGVKKKRTFIWTLPMNKTDILMRTEIHVYFS